MEIVLGLVALVLVIIFIGKLKGAPSPKAMTDEAIMARLQSENNWIKRYQALPSDHPPGDGLRKQHDEKQRYVMELMLELNTRHGKKEESLAPVIQRAYELMRQGVPESEAQERAIAEYVADRDSRRAATKVNPENQS